MSAGDGRSGTQVPLTDSERIGWATGDRVSGGGSAGTLAMSDEEKAEVAARPRNALGFAPPKTDGHAKLTAPTRKEND